MYALMQEEQFMQSMKDGDQQHQVNAEQEVRI